MKLANLFRYTELTQNLVVIVPPTGEDDTGNIQDAVDRIRDNTIVVGPQGCWHPSHLVTHSRRKWKWPWDKRTVVDIRRKGGTMHFANVEYIIKDTIKQRGNIELRGCKDLPRSPEVGGHKGANESA